MEDERGIFQSPRVAVSIFIALCIIAAALFATYSPHKYTKSDIAVADVTPVGIHQDIDSDGLEAWQEELWKTNPHNADSDGDGTFDGEEVKVGRDPLIQGPNDRKEDHMLVATSTYYYDEDPTLTTTDVIGRDLLSGAAALEQTGELTDQNVDVLINSLIKKAESRMPSIPAAYSPNDIRVSQSDDAEGYRAYFNGIATIALTTESTTISNENMSLIWTSKDMELRKTIAAQEIAREDSLIKSMLPLVVPASLAKPHLTIINALAENKTILSKVVQGTALNPLEDLLWLKEFQTRIELINTNVETLFSDPIIAAIPWSDIDPIVILVNRSQSQP